MTFLATILAQLAVAVLQWIASREDLKRSVREEIDLEGAHQALVALGWFATAPSLPDHGAGLRDQGGQLELGTPPDAHPSGPPAQGALPH